MKSENTLPTKQAQMGSILLKTFSSNTGAILLNTPDDFVEVAKKIELAYPNLTEEELDEIIDRGIRLEFDDRFFQVNTTTFMRWLKLSYKEYLSYYKELYGPEVVDLAVSLSGVDKVRARILICMKENGKEAEVPPGMLFSNKQQDMEEVKRVLTPIYSRSGTVRFRGTNYSREELYGV